MTERHVTALHEAAHHVLAYRLGLDLGPVSIEPAHGLLGVSLSGSAFDRENGISDEVTVCHAGRAIEAIVGRKSDERQYAGDEAIVADRLRTLSSEEFKVVRQRLYLKALELVRDNLGTIRALAAALEQHSTLSSEEAEIVIDAADEGSDWSLSLHSYRESFQSFSRSR